MNNEKLLAACRNYQTNRAAQKEKKWDKIADCEAIFVEMKALGAQGCSGSAGFFSGAISDNEQLFVNIGDEKIAIEKTNMGIFEWFDSLED